MRAAVIAALVILIAAEAPRYDFVLVGGTVVDGTGRPAVKADVAVAGGRIAAIGTIPRDTSRIIDVRGLVISPGFVDVLAESGEPHVDPAASALVRMGVTTIVGGNLGLSPLEIGDALDRVRDAGSAVNYATLIGHATVRRAVVADEDMLPSAGQLARMKALVWKGMADGAIGLSVGRRSVPGKYAKYPELAELARVAANAGGVYATELPVGSVPDGIAEVAAIADATGGRVEISHLTAGASGSTADVLRLLSAVRARGAHVLADIDPGSPASDGLRDFDLDPLVASTDIVIASNGAVAREHGSTETRPYDYPARLLGAFVRDRHLLSMEAAVRKMTWLPAEHYRLTNRGVVRAGAWADLVLFDPRLIGADANAPAAAQGIRAVFVNGEAVLRDGVQTSSRPGRVLAKSLLERR